MHFSWMNLDLMWIMGILPRMVGQLSFVIGIGCIMLALRKGFALAGSPFQFSWKNERLLTLFYFSLGALLIYFPNTLYFSSLSLFKLNYLGNANDVIAYHELHLVESFQEIRDIILKYSSLIGIIIFIKGIDLLLEKSYFGERNKTANAALYMLGGILFINIMNSLHI